MLRSEMCAADRAGERTSKTFIALSELLLSQRRTLPCFEMKVFGPTYFLPGV